MLLHCSSPHICRWVARPPGCPSDTAHRRTSCTLLPKAKTQLANTFSSGRKTSLKRYIMHLFPVCSISLYCTSIYFTLLIFNRIFFSHTPVFRSVASAVYRVLLIVFLSHCVLVRVSSSGFLFYLIFSIPPSRSPARSLLFVRLFWLRFLDNSGSLLSDMHQ